MGFVGVDGVEGSECQCVLDGVEGSHLSGLVFRILYIIDCSKDKMLYHINDLPVWQFDLLKFRAA